MRSRVLLNLLLAASVTIGCAKVIGLEKREAEEDGSDLGGNRNDDGSGGSAPMGPVDEKTGKTTTKDCIEYCDAMDANCTDQDQQYISRDTCINTCNALEPGERSEPLGNTVSCRLSLAKSASSAPGEFCPSAGALGGGDCGTNCDAWCSLLKAACPDDYGVLPNCLASCAGIKDSGNRSFQTSYPSAPDLQCRVYHLGAAFDNVEVHCPHARYIPESTCVDPEPEPTCDEYCSKAMANCRAAEGTQPNRMIYESKSQCMAACAVFPKGMTGEQTPNTVGCRTYHATASASVPATHCSHASPGGDGHCGLDGEAGTGNCTSYCLLYQRGCSDEFDAEFADLSDCAQTCSADFAERGAPKDRLYTIETAPSEDTLQCRIFQAVRATAGDESACEKAALGGVCGE